MSAPSHPTEPALTTGPSRGAYPKRLATSAFAAVGVSGLLWLGRETVAVASAICHYGSSRTPRIDLECQVMSLAWGLVPAAFAVALALHVLAKLNHPAERREYFGTATLVAFVLAVLPFGLALLVPHLK